MKKSKKVNDIIGGQAVIEGVMMINRHKAAIAVRKPNNKISLKKQTLKDFERGFFKWPLVRGIVKLFMMLIVGMKALNYSANESIDEEEEELSSWQLGIMIVFSLGLAITLFKFLPLFLANIVTKKIPQTNYIVFNILDGVIKIGLFVLYIYFISFLKDVKILFQYHGAEHKTVHCHEAKKELTVKNVKKFSTLHPRCGTAFILIVLTLSIIVYTFIPADTSFIEKFLYRILLLPVVAGISYEFLRLSSKNTENYLFKILTAPGLWLQKLTTNEPTNKQIEVAIKAMNAVK